MSDQPNPDCPTCGGEGLDGDPYGMFDYPCMKPCEDCWKREQPPVDRKLLCAREALRTEWLRDPQGTTATDQCIRAIELWEEGFGK